MAKKVSKMYGRAIIQPATLDVEKREVVVVFATEALVRRFSLVTEEEFDEVLACEESNIRMDRVNHGLPVLDCHDRSSVFKQVGRSSDVWINEEKKLCARLRFSQRTNVKGLFQDIADGIVTDISVGYDVYKYQRESQGEGKVPIYRAVDWMPTEISLAPVPADIDSGVRSDNPENHVVIINKINSKKRTDMKKITCPECGHEFEADEADKYTCPECGHEFTAEAANEPAGGEGGEPAAGGDEGASRSAKKPNTTDVAAIRAQASVAEKSRLNAILVSTRAAKMPEAFAIELYQSNKDIAACRQAILDKVIEGQGSAPSGAHTMRLGAEAVEKKREAIQGAILHRVHPSVFTLESGAREFRGMTLLEISKELLTEAGVNTRGLGKNELADAVFSRRSHSSSDFPLLFEGIIDRMLRAQYQFAPEFWSMISRQTSVSDFRAKGLYQVGSKNGMAKIAEGGEMKYTTLTESKQTIRVENFGQGIKLTRQALINDDLGAFAIIPENFVRNWDTLRGNLVWGLITDNVKMDDGKPLFHADHKNLLTGTDSALSEAGLSKAEVLMSRQTDIAGEPIRVLPKFLIVPPEKKVIAKKLISTITASKSEDVNVFANEYDVIVENRLKNADEWYLTADPNAIDGLFHAYLEGDENLRVHSEDDFNTDTIKYAVRGDFGVAAIDFRGFVKSNGK